MSLPAVRLELSSKVPQHFSPSPTPTPSSLRQALARAQEEAKARVLTEKNHESPEVSSSGLVVDLFAWLHAHGGGAAVENEPFKNLKIFTNFRKN